MDVLVFWMDHGWHVALLLGYITDLWDFLGYNVDVRGSCVHGYNSIWMDTDGTEMVNEWQDIVMTDG